MVSVAPVATLPDNVSVTVLNTVPVNTLASTPVRVLIRLCDSVLVPTNVDATTPDNNRVND